MDDYEKSKFYQQIMDKYGGNYLKYSADKITEKIDKYFSEESETEKQFYSIHLPTGSGKSEIMKMIN